MTLTPPAPTGGVVPPRPVRADERGAVAVEAALVSLFLFTILAGIVDLSMFFMTSSQVTQATRAGSRTAAADPLATTFADNAAKQVAVALRGLAPSRVTRIWVYKANPSTGQPVSGAACGSTCFRFTLDANGNVASRSGSWSGRSACAGGTVDAVGVLVEYRYDAPIRFADEQLVQQYTVMRLEEVPMTRACVST